MFYFILLQIIGYKGFLEQLVSVTNEIYVSFDEECEFRGIALAISKVYDKVWHQGLIFMLEQNEVSDKMLHLIKDFLSCKKQHMTLNGQCSSWMDVQSGVSQGPIYGSSFFLVYINDLPDNLLHIQVYLQTIHHYSFSSRSKCYADQINNDLHNIKRWTYL